jgi:predicted DNA-binding transcriptional regulator YafY
MERVIRLISVLTARSTPVPAEDLVRVGGYHAVDPDDAKRMLTRDIAQLNSTGWDIRNVAPPGEPGRWQLRARDNRLRVGLTPAQRAELVRAALAAGRPGLAGPLGPGDPRAPGPDAGPAAVPSAPRVVVTEGTAPDETLADALRAVALHCLARFTYKDVARVAHPWSVHPGPSGWYLRAREDGHDTVKEFVVSRMGGLELDRPGTAEVPASSPRPQLDPLRWQVDPPLRAVVETTTEHRPQVEHLLGEPGAVEVAGDIARLSYEVNHRGPFRWRLYELGPRVRLLAPEALRKEIEAELVAVTGTAR